MTTETILTDKDLDRCTDFLNEVPYDVDYDLDHIHRACRNTEQAVLQSEQVQAWKRDSELFKLLLDFYWFQSAFDRFDPADGGKQDKFESECRRILGAAQGQGGRDDT